MQAALAPVVGAEAVAEALAAGLGNLALSALQPAQVDGSPALVLRLDGHIDTLIALTVDHGLITGRHSVRNPDKLGRRNERPPCAVEIPPAWHRACAHAADLDA